MHILVISGSRNPDGQTMAAAGALVKGVRAAGGTAAQRLLPELVIDRCRQCDGDGWGECRSQGQCVIRDDFDALVEEIGHADAVVFATPVYFADLSESLRAFLDRLRRVTRNENAREAVAGKPAIGLCVAGGGGGGAPNCAVNLEKILATTGFDLVDMIPVRRQNAELKQEVLEATGRWLVEKISGP